MASLQQWLNSGASKHKTTDIQCATLDHARYWRTMSNLATYVDGMMLAIQFIIHEEFLHIAKGMGVFDSWEKSNMTAECSDMEDGTGRVVLTICGPVDPILQIERDIRAADLPDDTMLWHEGPFGPQPCAHA